MAMPPLPPPPGGPGGVESPPPVPSSNPASRLRRSWVLVLSGVITVVALMAASAAITYALTRTGNGTSPNGTPSAAESSSAPTSPTYSAAEREEAKHHVCEVFKTSVTGQAGTGSVVVDGGPNVPVVLRKLGSAVAVEHALTPETPNEVMAGARRYIDTQLNLVTAAMAYVAPAPVDEVNRLTMDGNAAIRAFADVCGWEY